MKKYKSRWLLSKQNYSFIAFGGFKRSILVLGFILYLISFLVDNQNPEFISFPVKIIFHGQAKEIFTLRHPVRKILIDNDIPFSKNDHGTPGLDHIIQPGEQINIIRILPKKNPDLAKNNHTSKPAWGVLVTPNGVYRYTRLIFMEATAYYPGPESTSRSRCHGLTRTGKKARYGLVAVDPKVISLGTMLYIEGYGKAEAADTGGAIKGKKIDLCFPTYQEAKRYGRKIIKVYVLKP